MHRHLMNDASCGILSETSMIWCMCVWCRYLVLSSSQNFTLLELNLHQHFCQCWRALALWRNTSHTHTHTSLTEFAVLMPLYIPPDDDLVKFETCVRNISDRRLFIIDCAVCWLEYCVIRGARCT